MLFRVNSYVHDVYGHFNVPQYKYRMIKKKMLTHQFVLACDGISSPPLLISCISFNCSLE